MRKLVLIILCVALFSFCPIEKDYPLIDLITTNKVLQDVKHFFSFAEDDEANGSDSIPELTSSIVKLFDKATEAFSAKFGDPALDVEGDDQPDNKGRQSLDLSLPHMDAGVFDPNISISDSEQDNRLPDLFASPEKKEKDARASIGGRLLMDEDNPNYTMDAVLGAELSLELKTH